MQLGRYQRLTFFKAVIRYGCAMATAAFVLPQRRAETRPLFVATIFAGSFFLFLMQPMVARMALPRLGGTPAVWNSAMLVYQALLLAGYSYAHVLARLALRRQALVHVIVLLLAVLWLPLGLRGFSLPADASPLIWVPWLLLSSIGPLFFAVSAQAPLLQRWAATQFGDRNPYALYIASNLGSFGGLITYPLLVEPLLPLAWQSTAWSIGYVLLIAMVAACGFALTQAQPLPTEFSTSKSFESSSVSGRASGNAGAPPTLSQRLLWIALAAVPSGMILAVTTHLTTDIIAMPLIWVIPLGLYLLSFSIAFSSRDRFARAVSWGLPLILIVAGAMGGSGQYFSMVPSIAADLLLLFGTSIALHHRLYRSRPDPAHLTDFYLCMSAGGVAGGLFCGLIAPALFDSLYEFPILVVAAALLMPMRADAKRLTARQRRWITVGGILLSCFGGGMLFFTPSLALKAAVLVVLALLARSALAHRILFAALIALLLLGLGGWTNIAMSMTGDTRTRSYFGIYTVSNSGNARMLMHGTTTHGFQLLAKGLETYPTSYYAPKSGVGIAMQAAPILFGPGARIGAVGLGAGTLACYAKPDQDWRFYEIDPAIVGIARNSKKFTFLSRCLPHADIAIGDARLTLAHEPTASRDLLVIDAFSSDSIPMHLLTREAIANYSRVLSAQGLLLFHISNRYVDLRPVLAAAAADGGWSAALRNYDPAPRDAQDYRVSHSIWVAFAKSPTRLKQLTSYDPTLEWTALQPKPGFKPWTDDYGSILPLLHRP